MEEGGSCSGRRVGLIVASRPLFGLTALHSIAQNVVGTLEQNFPSGCKKFVRK